MLRPKRTEADDEAQALFDAANAELRLEDLRADPRTDDAALALARGEIGVEDAVAIARRVVLSDGPDASPVN